jgi:Fic family protein
VDITQFGTGAPGALVPVSGFDQRHGESYDHWAFVPNALPETFELSDETWAKLAAAMHALGRLDQAGRQVPNPSLFRRPAIRREAVSTSALEGTYAAFTDVLEADLDETAKKAPEVVEVLNYVDTAELAFDAIQDRSISVSLLSEFQARLVAGTSAATLDSGRLRERQVLIGPEGCKITEARFVPVPQGDQLVAGMNEWESWINHDRGLPIVLEAAVAHYQFETLHPFHDGNGRIGRLVIVLQLLKSGIIRDALLTVSPWLEARRLQYQDHLLAVSHTGNYDPWVSFFADAITAQAESTVTRIERLLEFNERIRESIRNEPIRGVAARIAEDLIGRPVVSPTWAAKEYGVSYPAANAAISRLVRLGLLVQLTKGRYDRTFGAPEVIGILEA